MNYPISQFSRHSQTFLNSYGHCSNCATFAISGTSGRVRFHLQGIHLLICGLFILVNPNCCLSVCLLLRKLKWNVESKFALLICLYHIIYGVYQVSNKFHITLLKVIRYAESEFQIFEFIIGKFYVV